eukprot:TRINITY_DN12429_c0_g1_i1.p1 TRINITY_DN12429_c0_g1~~TRINITY_DN12429_c0_g1_i1.p1  ORF type:complete len:105 (+),score=17.13 TRINITY_DN12429_c0_g1_i1:48-362(+)
MKENNVSMVRASTLLNKVILLGDIGVGKTSLLHQFCYGTFKKDTAPTIGCDFIIKDVEYQGITLKLQFWDVPGGEKHFAIMKMFFRNTADWKLRRLGRNLLKRK